MVLFMKNILERILSLKGTQSTAAFGRSVGLNQQTMDRYLKGREPPIGVIQQLCVVYGVSADWLLGLSERGGSAAQATANGAHSIAVAGTGAKVTAGGDCAKCKLMQAHIREITGRG